MSHSVHHAFALLVVGLLALAPRCADPEEGTPIAASGGSTPTLVTSSEGPDAAPFPVPTSFPGEGR